MRLHAKHSEHPEHPGHLKKIDAPLLYLIIAGCSTFATGIIFVISMIYQIETVKLNPLQLTLVGTTLEVACFIGQIPTGALADTYSRRLAVVIGYSLMGIGFLVEGLFPTFSAVLLAQLLWGCGSTFVSGAQEAWCADEIGEQQIGSIFVRGNQIGQFTGFLAIPLGIWLGTYRLNAPVVAGALTLLILGLFLLVFMPEQHFRTATGSEQKSWRALIETTIVGGRALKKSRMLWMIVGVTAFVALASEGFDRLQADHFISDYTFPAIGHWQPLIWFGVISGGARLLTLGATEVVRRRADTSRQTTIIALIAIFHLCWIGGTIFFALTGNFYIAMLTFWIAAIGRDAMEPIYNTWITQNTESRGRATIFSMLGQVDAVGQITGGPIVGYIGTVVNLRMALVSTAILLTPGLLFVMGAFRIKKRAAGVRTEEIESDLPAIEEEKRASNN